MEFTADQVWACAAAAQRINGGYFKEDVWNHNSPAAFLEKRANKSMVKEWLRTNNFVDVIESDYAAGQKARDHFKSYTLLALTGKMNEFQSTAMRIASKDTFTGRDMYDFAVISCLPSVAERDVQKNALKRDIFASDQLRGNVGDLIVGTITVIQCRFNQNYNKFRVTARMGESFIDFWHTKELKGELRIKGKIKNVRCGEKTTQLNYVKIAG